MAVVGTQFYLAASNPNLLSSMSPLLSKDGYVADSVVQFRKTTPKIVENNNEDGEGKSDKDEGKEPALDYNGTPLHVVFSTSCSDQMHW